MIQKEILEKIKELEAKGFRIGYYPMFEKKVHQWTVCVRVGDDPKLTFIKGEEGFHNSSFSTKELGLKAIIKYCEEYIPKRTKEIVSKKDVRKK